MTQNDIMLAIIVDDNKQAGEDLAARLAAYDNIELAGIAQNGLDGLALVNQAQPDVVFLDIELPDISGLDFLDQLASATCGNCRAVMYTAYDEYILSAFRKKAFDVLLKPIDDTDLATIIQRLTNENVVVGHQKDAADKKQSSKFLFYTNTLDFKLINKCDIGLFQYDHELRCWELIVAGRKQPVRLRRNLKSEALVDLCDQFVQVNQRFIINMDYLVEVVDNMCHFYPPFDTIDYVKVSRIYRRKLIERFHSL